MVLFVLTVSLVDEYGTSDQSCKRDKTVQVFFGLMLNFQRTTRFLGLLPASYIYVCWLRWSITTVYGSNEGLLEKSGMSVRREPPLNEIKNCFVNLLL